MRNRDFGTVRSVRVEQYAGAAGGLNIDQKIKEAATNVAVLRSAYDQSIKTFNNHKINRVEGGYCANTYSNRSKREQCQRDQQSWLNTYASRMTSAKLSWESAKNVLEALRKEKAEQIKAISTLAEQGLTPQAVQQTAEAEAQAITQNALIEAQAKERQSKSKRTIVILIVVALIVVGAIYLVKRFKK